MWAVTVVGRRIPGRGRPATKSLPALCRSLPIESDLDRELLQNGVFKRLGRTQTNNRLGLDFNLLAGLGIAAKARLAVCLYYAADIGDDKFSGGALCFFNCKFEQLFKEEHCGLF
jgi:hypothetical protein